MEPHSHKNHHDTKVYTAVGYAHVKQGCSHLKEKVTLRARRYVRWSQMVPSLCMN